MFALFRRRRPLAVLAALLAWNARREQPESVSVFIDLDDDAVEVAVFANGHHQHVDTIAVDAPLKSIAGKLNAALNDVLSRPTEPDDDADTYAPTDPHIVLLRAIDAWTPPHGVTVQVLLDTGSKLLRVHLAASMACATLPIPADICPENLSDALAQAADTVLRVNAAKAAACATATVEIRGGATPAETGPLAKAWETFRDGLRPHGLDA